MMEREPYVLVYNLNRDRWFVEETATGRRRRFPTREKAVAALDHSLCRHSIRGSVSRATA